MLDHSPPGLEDAAHPAIARERQVSGIVVQNDGVENVALSDTAVAIADAQQLGAISGRRQQRRLGAETGVGDAGDLAQVGAVLLAADEIRAEGDLHASGLSNLDRLAEARLQLANAGRGGG